MTAQASGPKMMNPRYPTVSQFPAPPPATIFAAPGLPYFASYSRNPVKPVARAPWIMAAMTNRFAHLLHGAIAESALNPTTVLGLRSLALLLVGGVGSLVDSGRLEVPFDIFMCFSTFCDTLLALGDASTLS